MTLNTNNMKYISILNQGFRAFGIAVLTIAFSMKLYAQTDMTS